MIKEISAFVKRSDLRIALAILLGIVLVEGARSSKLYTIGDEEYDKSLAKGRLPLKLGKIPVAQVPSHFPKEMLEKDGSYGGGIVFLKLDEAEKGRKELLEKGVLSTNQNWHIYELEGNLSSDVYLTEKGEYRLIEPTKVKRRVSEK